MTKAKRMSDGELAERARNYKTHRAAEAAEKALAEADRDAITTELAARKVRVADVAGVHIAMTTTWRMVSLDRARTLLSRVLLKRVTKTIVDMDQWNLAKQCGDISKELDGECRADQPVTPYIKVDVLEVAAAA